MPRPSYDTRRRLIGVMHGRSGWSVNGAAWGTNGSGHAPAESAPSEPAFRAPWGELERQIPYVTITTQPFPTEWWTPPSLRAEAVTRATAHPVDLLTRPIPVPQLLPMASEIEPAIDREPRPTAAELARTPARAAELDELAASAAEVAASAPDPDDAILEPGPRRRAAARPRRAARTSGQKHQRRGFLARVVLVTLGLVISLVAVETATRRRA